MNGPILKPLTPYNFYYRDERNNIIQYRSSQYTLQPNDDPTLVVLPNPIHDFSEERLQQLLYERWYIDPYKEKRKHRKTQSTMDFREYVLLQKQQQQQYCFSSSSGMFGYHHIFTYTSPIQYLFFSLLYTYT